MFKLKTFKLNLLDELKDISSPEFSILYLCFEIQFNCVILYMTKSKKSQNNKKVEFLSFKSFSTNNMPF